MNAKSVVTVFIPLLSLLLTGCAGGGFVHEGVPKDNQPPQIRQVKVTPNMLVTRGKQVTIEATVTDEQSGVKAVTAEVTYPDGGKETLQLTPQGNDLFSGNFNAFWNENAMPQNVNEWFIRVVVKAADNSGNIAQSPETKVRVAITPPDLPSGL